MNKLEFKIPVSYVKAGTVKIEANSLEEAYAYAKEHIEELPLDTDDEYVDGSYEIGDFETAELMNEEK